MASIQPTAKPSGVKLAELLRIKVYVLRPQLQKAEQSTYILNQQHLKFGPTVNQEYKLYKLIRSSLRIENVNSF